MNKIKTAVLFGGISSEHEISLLSVANILNSIPKDKYEIYPLGITKAGKWLYCPKITNEIPENWETDGVPAYISPDATIKGIITQNGVLPIDVVFPVLHGKGGEDGTVQGLLQLAQIPYVGCGVLSSALCMDKITANRVMDACNIPRCEWLCMTADQMIDFDAIEKEIASKLKYPVFVKPSNAGSSVGVSKAKDKQQLKNACALALKHDSRIIFERFVKGREIECAVMGNINLQVSSPGEILASAEFYDYDDKYKNGTSRTQIPADLPKEILEKMRQIAASAYKCLACEGLARVDFFVEDNKVLLNEINTMPGFTAISMYPKMMQASGLNYNEICDKLICFALEKSAT